MIYEMALVVKPELPETELTLVKDLVKSVITDHEGETFIDDDWGTIKLAQKTSNGTKNGHFLYFVFKANNKNNTELLRRLKISENVLRSQIYRVGDDGDEGVFVKNYKTPFSKKYAGSLTDVIKESDSGERGGKRRFTRSRCCWYGEHQIKPNWKDPETFSWVLNEFGKISPARVTNISRKNQRDVTKEIKRARQLGIASFISNRIARKLS